MKQLEEKVVLDTPENNNNNAETIKKYKREIQNLHRALSRIQRDNEKLIVENRRLKEIIQSTK